MRTHPAICTACGRTPGARGAAVCARCGASESGVVWTRIREPRPRRALRLTGALALLAASPWGLVLLIAALRERPGRIEEWLLWAAFVLLSLMLVGFGAFFVYFAMELALRRDWSFRSADERRRGTVRTLFGRVLSGGGVFNQLERVPVSAPGLSSRAVMAAGGRALLGELLPALGRRPGEEAAAPVWSADGRRTVELALLGALLGLVARGRLSLQIERLGGWFWDRARREPRSLPPRLTTRIVRVEEAMVGGSDTATPAGERERLTQAADASWLERQILELASGEPRRVEELARGIAGTRLDPWRWIEDGMRRDATALGPVDPVALGGVFAEFFRGTPDVAAVLWSEIERGLMNSAIAAHELWRFTPQPPHGEANLPN